MRRPASPLERLDGAADWLERRLEQRWRLVLLLVSLLYLLVTGLIAARRPFWNDELFTLYLARLGPAELWTALGTGGEQIPPLFHLTSRAFVQLLGESELALRLPEIVGFWVMGLCLFAFVARRLGALHGLVALLFPLVTGAYPYAYEARPYAIVLGLAGLALLCWQRASEGRRRRLSLVVLALSLALAVANHYYAVLLLLPLGLGEGVRSLGRRRLDPAVWAAMAAGALLPLVLFLPLIRQARGDLGVFWARPELIQLPNFYGMLLMQATLPLAGALIVVGLYASAPMESRLRGRERAPAPVHELAAALGLIAIPAAALALGLLVTQAFTYRYALPAVLGFAVLIAYAASRILGGRAVIGMALITLLGGGFLVIGAREYRAAGAASGQQAGLHAFLSSQTGGELPIVVMDHHTFTALSHYAPPELAPRLVYLADPGASLRYLGHDSIERGMLRLERPWFGFRAEEYAPFLAAQDRFLAFGLPNEWNWLLTELAQDGRRAELVGRTGDYQLFVVASRGLPEAIRTGADRRSETYGGM